MTGVERARELAVVAAGLARGAGIRLPSSLALWSLAGGRPPRVPGEAAADPAQALCDALEGVLTAGERRRGAHYTPEALADRVAALALPEGWGPGPVADPACGGGALLLAAGRRLVQTGVDRVTVARELLWGADVDPVAAAVTEAAVALWAAGAAPRAGHVVAGDPLRRGSEVWTRPPRGGFAAVVGNPPFQAQLARATARSMEEADALRRRFGGAVSPYVDTAALFLLVGADLAAPGARVVMVQPQSTAAARDAGGVRAALAERATLVDLWAPPERLFAARVHVCVPVLLVGRGGMNTTWTGHLATARGVPPVDLAFGGATAGAVSLVVAGFRDHYYGVVPHVAEARGSDGEHPLVTSGLIGLGTCGWGEQPVRFAKRRWATPVVDVDEVRASSTRLDGWLRQVLRPKLVVASQTRVLEAAADEHGTWVPATPAVSLVPHDAAQLPRLLAAVCSPPAAAWAARRAAGTALSADAIRVSASLLGALPLPTEDDRWTAAVEHLAARDLDAYADAATAMYGLGPRQAAAVVDWWLPIAKPTWLANGVVR